MNVAPTAIAGLYSIELDVHDDDRGSFREAFQAAKLATAGLPPFQPVQYNVAYSRYGTIRGIHAEPWEKYIHPAHGTAFAAIVDIRPGSDTFKQVATFELDEHHAIFVPRGCGNSVAATSPELAYTYLVNEHWQTGQTYPAVAYDDPELAIDWPIPEAERLVSDKDRRNPTLQEAFPDGA